MLLVSVHTFWLLEGKNVWHCHSLQPWKFHVVKLRHVIKGLNTLLLFLSDFLSCRPRQCLFNESVQMTLSLNFNHHGHFFVFICF